MCIRVDYCGTKIAVSNQNCICHVYFFFILKYLCNLLLYIPSICSNCICFKLQMTLGAQLGLDNQWKVYSNLMRIWMNNLCHFKYQAGFLSSVSNLMDLKTQGIIHFRAILTWIMTYTCAFTVAYAVLWLKVLLHYSAMKVFYIRHVISGKEGEVKPTLFLDVKKMPWFWKKRPWFCPSWG